MEYQVQQILQSGSDSCVPTVIAEIANWHLRNTNKKVDDKQLYREMNPTGGGQTLSYALNYGKNRGLPLQNSERVFIKDFNAYSNSYGYAEQALSKSPCAIVMKAPCGANLTTQTAQPPFTVHTFFISHCVALIGFDKSKQLFKCLNSQTDVNGGIFYLPYMWFGSQVIELYNFTLLP